MCALSQPLGVCCVAMHASRQAPCVLTSVSKVSNEESSHGCSSQGNRAPAANTTRVQHLGRARTCLQGTSSPGSFSQGWLLHAQPLGPCSLACPHTCMLARLPLAPAQVNHASASRYAVFPPCSSIMVHNKASTVFHVSHRCRCLCVAGKSGVVGALIRAVAAVAALASTTPRRAHAWSSVHNCIWYS